VCLLPLDDASMTGYISKAEMPILVHNRCLEGLEQAIIERRGGGAVRKSAFADPQPETVQTKPIKKHGYTNGRGF
jgi:hypothetical protein